MPILLDEPITSTPRLTDAIADGETGKAPAQNAVYDALALKQARNIPSVIDYASSPSAFVGDGTTNEATVIAAAEASSATKIAVPDGKIVKTTSIATGAALTKTYIGPGQVKTNDGNKLPPSWRVVSAAPTAGDFGYILTAANTTDAPKVQGWKGTWITGAATLGQPTSGYTVSPETSSDITYYFVNTNTGYNYATASNDGRTGAAAHTTYVTHRGNGDAMAYRTSIFVDGARSSGVGGPGSPTDALAMPAGVVHGGTVIAGANDVYLNHVEMNANDGGFRASAGIFVANASRSNSSTTNNQFWFAFTAQSQGSVDADVAFRVSGKWKFGLDLTPATLDSNKAALALKASDRIYLLSSLSGSSRYCDSLGTTYITATSSGIDFAVEGAGALRVTSQASPVTYLQIQGTATGTPLQITTQSSDSNVGLDFRPKGTGTIRLRGGTGGVAQVQANDTGVGFFATAPIAKPTVTGSRGANAALASLLTALANLGLITDSSS